MDRTQGPLESGFQIVNYQGALDLIELDFRGNARVAECLSNGKTLAHRLAHDVSIDEGTTYAITAPDLAPEKLYEFDSGNVIPQLPREEWQLRDGLLIQGVVSARDNVAKAVAARLVETNGTFVAQEYYAVPTDTGFQRRTRPPWIFRDEIYYASLEPTAAEASDLLALDDIWPGLTSVVSTFDAPRPISSVRDIDSAMIDRIVHTAQELLIGVYDGESYLLWTTNSSVAEFYRLASSRGE